jgi:hypothetical protein
VPMTFVTGGEKDTGVGEKSPDPCDLIGKRQVCSSWNDLTIEGNSPYSVESTCASRAFKSKTVTVRPSILRIPSDCSREISSRTVPICEASS